MAKNAHKYPRPKPRIHRPPVLDRSHRKTELEVEKLRRELNPWFEWKRPQAIATILGAVVLALGIPYAFQKADRAKFDADRARFDADRAVFDGAKAREDLKAAKEELSLVQASVESAKVAILQGLRKNPSNEALLAALWRLRAEGVLNLSNKKVVISVTTREGDLRFSNTLSPSDFADLERYFPTLADLDDPGSFNALVIRANVDGKEVATLDITASWIRPPLQLILFDGDSFIYAEPDLEEPG
jgi:hypothetical protein